MARRRRPDPWTEAARRRSRLLTSAWGVLTPQDRTDALALARESAAQQVADELDQEARLGRLARGSDPWDSRVRSLAVDDPRRIAYTRHLRDTRAAYQEQTP